MNKLNNIDTLRFRVAGLYDNTWTIQEVDLYWFEESQYWNAPDIPDTEDVSRFTGQRDGAGVEIWEGDLIRYRDLPAVAVTFQFGAFGTQAIDPGARCGSFYVDPALDNDTFISFERREKNNLADWLSRIRVVGNIWQGVTKQEEV